MPIRTTESAVRDIIEVDDEALGTSGLSPFIQTASRMVDRYCDVGVTPTLAVTHDPPYEPAVLEEIERYLAAHFYSSSRDPRLVSETVSSLQNAFQMKTGFGLALTHHGQHAMLLDYYGGLADASALLTDDNPVKAKFVAGVVWGGKEYGSDGRVRL